MAKNFQELRDKMDPERVKRSEEKAKKILREMEEGNRMDINSCLDCARKHIGRANTRIYEFVTGDYPTEFWWAVGDLSLAEDHLIMDFPDIAKKIRDTRLRMMEDEDYYPSQDGSLEQIVEEITEIAINLSHSEEKE